MRFDSVESIQRFVMILQASPAWAALQDKTQVFNERKTKEVKTRGSHSEDVGRIAAALAGGLATGEDRELQAEKAHLIGLLHDLGHIPYGHAGESVADSIISGHKFTSEEKQAIGAIRNALFGERYNSGTKVVNKNGEVEESICFEHNENSVLQFIMICRQAGYEIDPEIVLGILAHSTSRYTEVPPTLAQQAVRLADKLAYINYDVNDLFQSFSENEEVLAALEKLYSKSLTVVNPQTGAEETVKIVVDGKEISMLEFAHLTPEAKINLFIQESIKDAQAKGRLTGCNDLIVEISGVQKKKKELEKERDKFPKDSQEYNELQKQVAEHKQKVTELYYQLYQRNPILYAAYILKERSDNFIRAGVGLSLETQEEKTMQAESAVGNRDLEKEYIYKQLVTLIEENINGLDQSKNYTEEEKRVINEFVTQFKAYKMEEDKVIKSLPGNQNGATYPVIYSIVNFIGSFTNSQLDMLAAKLRITDRYKDTVLPELQAILADEKYYDRKTGLLTKQGREAREEIVSKYGAQIKLRYGVEEESISPSTADEIIEILQQRGYNLDTAPTVADQRREERVVQQQEEKGISQEQEQFRQVASRKEQEQLAMIAQATQTLNGGRAL